MTESWTELEKIPVKPAKPTPPPKKPEEEEKKEEEKKEETKDGETPAADETEEKKEPEAAKEQEQAQEQPKAPEPLAEQQYETKQRTRERQYDIAFTTISHAIPPDQRKQYMSLESDLYKADREILDVKEAKNDLEAYAYEMKGNLDSYGNYEHYIDPAVRESYVQNLQATVDWIYGEGEQATLAEYQERLSALGAVGNPVKARYRFRSEIGEWIELFQKFKSQKVQPKLDDAQAGGETKLTEEQQKSIVDKVQLVDTYFAEIAQTLEKPKNEDLPYTIEQVENKINALKSEFYAILNAPPPKPPKEEKKEETGDGQAEENKEETNDAADAGK